MSVPEPLISGADTPLVPPLLLHAGSLTMQYAAGDLRYVRHGTQELVRRIYVAVRDHNWGTVPASLSDEQIEVGADFFRISYIARHREGPLDFAWRAVLHGAEDGTLRFDMDGLAQTTFLRNRIGFCILYPAALAGTRVRIEHSDASINEAQLPVRIVAAQPVPQFDDLRALHVPLATGGRLIVRTAGDIFEMEDQRNWTDASFKVFCTPLRLPYPVEVAAGTQIQQTVTIAKHSGLSIQEPEAALGDARREMSTRHNLPSSRDTPQLMDAVPPLTFAIDAQRMIAALPSIGLGLPYAEPALGDEELALLRLLRPAHLRVDLNLADATHPALLERASVASEALDTALEIALLLDSAAARAELLALRAQLDTLRLPVARWLIFSRERPVTPPQLVILARELLADYAPNALFGGGSNSDYIFVDRSVPLPAALDALSVAINPQVHAFDNDSLVETLAAQGILVADARHYASDRPVIVSPVTLRPRFNPYATAEVRSKESGGRIKRLSNGNHIETQLPSSVDRRQPSLFAAAWTLGSLKYLGLGGARSATYYETHGMRGVLVSAVRSEDLGISGAGTPLSRLFSVSGSAVFPLFHVLADVAGIRAAALVAADSSEPLLIDGLALAWPGGLRVLLANMSARPQRVRVAGLAERAMLRLLNSDVLAEAMQTRWCGVNAAKRL
ncbi:hypothetical protein HC891_04430 [Candidatus Gracilibacteria bacterium]|nr:hypothetical protein [Candidatus Gracilibacteria bacterium]